MIPYDIFLQLECLFGAVVSFGGLEMICGGLGRVSEVKTEQTLV